MIEVKEESIIYVLCPAYTKTGGPELLHQLVYSLNNNNIKSIITYFNIDLNNDKYTNDDFKKYVNEYEIIDNIKDDKNNIVIIPEIKVEFIKKYKNIKKVIWWLSVDNYEYNYNYKKTKEVFGFKTALKRKIKNILKNNKESMIYKADYHLCQSYYSIDFLKKKGIDNVIYLSDYINDSFLDNDIDYKSKENIVLYNPNKGYDFTKKIIEKSPNLNWVPIKNLTTSQVRDLLIKSKVYIDFGNHPGKDRFPRETAMCGCCVITGKKGSSKYNQDVPIYDEFKFNDDLANIDLIIRKINECLNDYDNQIKKFEDYRNFISKEKEKFNNDVKNIFKKID